MQSLFGERLRKLHKYKSAAQHKLILFYKSVAGDPGEVEIDWRLSEVESIQAFPGAVELEPVPTHIYTPPFTHIIMRNWSFTRIHSNCPWE